MKTFIILQIYLMCMCIAALAKDTGGKAVGKERLPGSLVSVREATEKADIIVIARQIDLGVASADFAGKTSYSDCWVSVQRMLKGSIDIDCKVDLDVAFSPPAHAEVTPKDGVMYKYFLKRHSETQFRVIKMQGFSR